jgi:[protein-PII] uridylyltransferase
LDTYCVLESDGSPILDQRRLGEIRARLLTAFTSDSAQPLKVTRRAPRQVRMFTTRVQVGMSQDPQNQRTVVELVAGDRPGLLFQIAKVFDEEKVQLQNAKVATVGERAEDVFFVTTLDAEALDDAQCERLKQSLRASLTDARPGVEPN